MCEDVIDKIVSGRIMRKVLFEVSNGKFDELEKLIKEIDEVKEFDFSDAAISRLSFLMHFLIDCKLYEYLFDLVETCSWIATSENKEVTDEECPLSYAIRMIKDDDIVIRLIELCDENHMSWGFFRFEQPSSIAVKLGRYELIPKLFEFGLACEEYGCEPYTILQYAVMNKDYELAELALGDWEHNPDLYNKFTPVTALDIAISKNDFDMVSLLLAFGADINATDKNGQTALAHCNSDEMHEFLVKKGAKESDSGLVLLCRAINDIKSNGFLSPDILDEILLAEISEFDYREDNLVLLVAKYGDVKSLTKLCRFSRSKSMNAELMAAVFSDYKLYGMRYSKTVNQLVNMTDIMIANSINYHRDTYLSEAFFMAADKSQIFNCADESVCADLFNNLCVLGFDKTNKELVQILLEYAVWTSNVPVVRFCLENGASFSDLNTESTGAAESLLCHMKYDVYKKEHPEFNEVIN